ncbi:hypothetical protein DW667_08740 [Coprococcus sp. AM25-15LB]|nr:hypothetical protein DW667_08740 [Coprococcus sp. AM25-15LB]RJW07719.1 hypothetical protein DW686_08185 [Coprococcus sp. AM25-4LB]
MASSFVRIDSAVAIPATFMKNFSEPRATPKLIFPESFWSKTAKTFPIACSHEKSWISFR